MDSSQLSIQQQFIVCAVAFGIHICHKIKDPNHRPINMLLITANFFWLLNSFLSFASSNLTSNPSIALRLYIASEVMDLFAKLLVFSFLYVKFRAIERARFCSTSVQSILGLMPFVLSCVYLVIGTLTACYMIINGQLFDTINPLYIFVASSDIALAILDLYVALKVYLVKRANPLATVMLLRLVAIMSVGFLLKLSTVFLFYFGLDPYWFYYLIVFPMNLFAYEMSNSMWIKLASSSFTSKSSVIISRF